MNPIHRPGRVSTKVKARRALWNVVAALLFRTLPTPLFWPWRRMLLRLFGAQVAADAYVYSSVRIWAPWLLQMDSRSCLGPHVICYNQDRVWLQSGVTVSQYAHLCNAGHDVDMPNTADDGLITAPITLGTDSWVGTQAYIGMGVEVGEGAIVGARASVYRDVEPMSIVGGNPAREIRKRNLKQ